PPITTWRCSGSSSNTMPPSAAITGTDSCTIAARAAPSDGSTAYHTQDPSPPLIAPHPNANVAPAPATCLARPSADTTNRGPHGTARAKLPALAASGRVAARPNSEYSPQVTPARNISAAPAGGGASRLGRFSSTSPVAATAKPIHCRTVGRSPRTRPPPIIV